MIFDQWVDDEHLRRPDHIEMIWAKMEQKFPEYFQRYAQGGGLNLGKLGKLGDVSAKGKSSDGLMRRVRKALEQFAKEKRGYDETFDPDELAACQSDSRAFARDLERDVAVIRHAMHSDNPEMRVWKIKYQRVKRQNPDDLLRVFMNIVDFAEHYPATERATGFAQIDAMEDFGFQEFDEGVEDESRSRAEGEDRSPETGLIRFGKYHILGVIGLGIVSTVLCYRNPAFFPHRSRQGLIGFYFLSDREKTGMPSDSSEFLMYRMLDDDTTIEHNFFYPYSPFALYSNRLARRLEQELAERGVDFDPTHRFVYTDDFLAFVADQHRDETRDWKPGFRY
jgi:hypothetical protein